MVAPMDLAQVYVWGDLVGAVAWDRERGLARFEFDPAFVTKGLDLAPLTMPLADARRGRTLFEFPALPRETFQGLPGLLADSLPDNYGNRIIDAWLARQGRTPESFHPVERLCYTGTRGMGALEFHPPVLDGLSQSVAVDVSALVELAQEVLSHRTSLQTNLGHGAEALQESRRGAPGATRS